MKVAENMKLHLRQRTIRPSTRRPESQYKVTVEDVSPNDLIVIFIDHESEDFREIYQCRGSAFQNRSASVNFRWIDDRVKWQGEASLERVPLKGSKSIECAPRPPAAERGASR
jgi:hypothetical protein